ncbi:cytochrome-c oxidase, cbb3-type subunit III [Rhodospirillaceae bacterium KN72]|uniref:Cbb3-type cytochrome c oxidase subunit n=1 Tax=Pacificispira spongiicola TaxID=2729598 RepID=A0A7Y0HDW2_9PROT|nr:cytochrome-c oxidase, cbb3-type subunit III [Pacificispira spongiicola]NMM44075.1 cytochrome-c oxidase, cbb3-type subunit III [Pacificispira spongiicola]
MPTKIEKDSVTGVETTGHTWDGIQELNNPLPRWWLYVFYACIIWSIGYAVMFPSVPLGTTYFEGTEGYSARVEVEQELAAADAAKGEILNRIATSDLEQIRHDDDMLAFSVAGGGAAFAENCVPCHGSGATGGPGYPSLQDDDWLWGGELATIQQTIQHGIRWDKDDDTRFSEMPAFGDGILETDQIEQVANYVLSLTGHEHDASAAAEGAAVFEEQCVACHMEGGVGNKELGAPALNDQVWLYADNYDAIVNQISKPRHGVMPAWAGRLNPVTIKMLTVYVHSLGGGQ